jgi:hypothetical protein
VHQEVGLGHLLQGGPEGLHQLVGQLADESHRVRHQQRLAPRQGEAAGGRVDGGEQPVLDQHARVGETVEERRLAGVRVADEGHRAQPGTSAGLTLGAAVVGHVPQLGLQLGRPPLEPPPVHLELGLTATETGPDAARLLAEGLPPPP